MEVDEKQQAIQDYRDTHFRETEWDIWAWGYYEFGILFMSPSRRLAVVYVDASCGYLRGHGVLYTLKRNWSGEWEIIDYMDLWVS